MSPCPLPLPYNVTVLNIYFLFIKILKQGIGWIHFLHISVLYFLTKCFLLFLEFISQFVFRYALEERRYGYHDDPQPWNKWDMLHIARYLLQNGARPSINHVRNSALACVLRHVTDWEFRYDLLNMLLMEGGDPNIEGRDGSVPLMVCLVPLINKDPLHHFSHLMKVRAVSTLRASVWILL